MPAEFFHLAVAWDWEYDRDFIALLEAEVQAAGFRSYSISHHNTGETARRIQRGQLAFGAFLDRASEESEPFAAVTRAIRKTAAAQINRPEAVARAADKATMHLEFLTHGVNVPFTIIISPYAKKKEIELTIGDLARLGRPFIIKPANTTGGGIGVILGAETLRDVIESRQHHKNDKYLLQEKIVPCALQGKKAWFRVFSIFGETIPCWWDDETHIYSILQRNDIAPAQLRALVSAARAIGGVCDLEFFSTEIAIRADGSLVAVDYVNEICDMRLQSKAPDGVPDTVVTRICRRIARHLRNLPRSAT